MKFAHCKVISDLMSDLVNVAGSKVSAKISENVSNGSGGAREFKQTRVEPTKVRTLGPQRHAVQCCKADSK